MLDSVQLMNFKAHRSTRIELGPFTMFVGDNASGKTSVLDALWLQAAIWPDPRQVLTGNFAPSDLLRRGATEPLGIMTAGHRGHTPWSARVDISSNSERWTLRVVGTNPGRFEAKLSSPKDEISEMVGGASNGLAELARAIGRVGLYRLRGDRIAATAYSDHPEARVETDGTNTAVALAAMKLGDDEAFARVETALRKLVPSVERIRIRRAEFVDPARGPLIGSKIYFDFRGAKDVPAHNASHGTLLILALLTIVHGTNRPSLVLLDELDQALHPRAQLDLVRMLKELIARDGELQIAATTHSPYILDGIEPTSVHAFALRDDGTVATRRLSEHPDAGKAGQLLSGQLWTLDPERDWVLRDQAA